MADLAGQRVLVVGGTAGIGRACAAEMIARGATVTIAGRNPERGRMAADALGALLVAGDAAVAADAERMVAEAAEGMGGLDVSLSAAGGDPMPRLLRDTPVNEVMGDVTRTLAPVILPARAAYDVMGAQGHGCILMIASDAGKIATPGEAAIGAAMAGIAMFARGMATEGKRQGIRVNTLTPSVVRGTPLYDKLMADPFAGKLFGKAEGMAHLGVTEPEDLAHLAAFLASPAAARITGQTISVTGGISAI
ncbi:MAG: SDR family NAD(P)-dependent oxidoreductase [Pseudooceanicola sp.]